MIGLFLFFALMVGRAVALRVPAGQRALMFLILMPMYTATAFSIAAGLTVAADLAVRLIVRPRLLSWLAPRVDADGSTFHLEPREKAVGDIPARMAIGRRWTPGRLVFTDRRLLFLPVAWDVEPWSISWKQIDGANLVDPARSFWGLIRGIPPHLEVFPLNDSPRLFAVLDAFATFQWFPAPSSANPEHFVS